MGVSAESRETGQAKRGGGGLEAGLELLRPERCKKHGQKLASEPISEETLSANFFQKFG